MFLQQLHIINFKNHKEVSYSFSKNLVAFTGKNGVGKTNILDAIYYLCIGKSYFSSTDKQVINTAEDFSRVTSVFLDEAKTPVSMLAILQKGKRKKLIYNEIPETKLANHLGKLPVVIVAPDDNIIVLGGSENRRRFLDNVLSQANAGYLNTLIKYNKILTQKNSVLKTKPPKTPNIDLLEVYDKQLNDLAQQLFEVRKVFIEDIQEKFNTSYQTISGNNDRFSLSYKSHLFEKSFYDWAKETREKDIFLQRSTKGVHQDDLIFSIKNEKLKNFGSQGQQKTFLLALKLAQYFYLCEKTNKKPIFIIDDLFDKLDANRSVELINYVRKNLNQVFITYTSKEILLQTISESDINIIEVI